MTNNSDFYKGKEREEELLKFLHEISNNRALNSLLHSVVNGMPNICGAISCSIYLLPKYINILSESIIDEDGNEIHISSMDQEAIILLADSSAQDHKRLRKEFSVN